MVQQDGSDEDLYSLHSVANLIVLLCPILFSLVIAAVSILILPSLEKVLKAVYILGLYIVHVNYCFAISSA